MVARLDRGRLFQTVPLLNCVAAVVAVGWGPFTLQHVFAESLLDGSDLRLWLKRGETVQFRPRGNSMAGKIESGQLCTVVPVRAENLNVGDIILCKVNGFQYLHLIKAIQGKRLQIGNNRGRINGWIGENGIYGKCIRIE